MSSQWECQRKKGLTFAYEEDAVGGGEGEGGLVGGLVVSGFGFALGLGFGAIVMMRGLGLPVGGSG